MPAVSSRFVKGLAALVWHVGAVALLAKGTRLLMDAEALDPGRLWLWLVPPAALLIGLLKARFLMLPAARANIVRIDALERPRVWQLYRPGFLVFLVANIVLAKWLIAKSEGHYTGMLLSAAMALTIGIALLGSSFVWWSSKAGSGDATPPP